MEIFDLRRRLAEAVLEIRGDGKAGGGLVLAFQSLAALFARDSSLHVQEWPFFGSARRGANIRSFLRVSRRPVMAACEVTRPNLVLLMDEGAAQAEDFARGVAPGGSFVLNTRHDPDACARHFRLSGRVLAVPGDEIGRRHLGHSIGNVSAYVALARVIGDFDRGDVIEGFLATLRKRHVPEAVVVRNRAALEASFEEIQEGVFDCAGPGDHAPIGFHGYGELPVGAQTPLRLSAAHATAHYAPSGFRLRFEDPHDACNGCGLCIANCPEGIIRFVPDSDRGVRVIGVDVGRFCKLCQECVAVCPEKLFSSVPYQEHWEETEVSTT
jgi:pyruvate ferredoxin oxidoreductase gamma subunit